MHTADSEAVYFREVQRCWHWWPWVQVIILAVFCWLTFIQQILFGVSTGDLGGKPVPDWLIIVLFVLFGVGAPWLLSNLKLTTEVRSDAVYVRFFPFHPKWIRITPDVIATATAGAFSHMKGFYAPGILRGRGGNTYFLNGNQGVRFDLANDRHLIIGSQRADELAAAVEQMRAVQSVS